jgi:peptidoglycan/LPS O-acetylase OafA/YrhL
MAASSVPISTVSSSSPTLAAVRHSHVRVPELDGVRAIAIWMVLLLHGFFAPQPPSMPKLMQLVMGHGWLGVDLFFVLSGFLITGILLDAKGKKHYFRTFYTRRFLRIMPVYFAVVLVWSCLYRGHASYFLLSSGFMANLAPLFHVRVPHGPGVLWSLAIEEQFYLFWPILVLVLRKRQLAFIASSLVLIEPILRGIYAARGMNPLVIYELSWFRCDGLAVGALIAMWVRSSYFSAKVSRRIACTLIIALALLTIFGSRFGLLGTMTVTGVAFRYTQAYLFFAAGFVLVIAHPGSPWTAPLRWRFMQLSGALSYCLYLVHLSIGDAYQGLIGRYHENTMFAALVHTIVMIAASFAVALVSKRFLEDPCLRLKDRLSPV